MTHSQRMARFGASGAVLAAALSFALPTPVAAKCMVVIGCGFSVNGKKGPYLQAEVTRDALAQADADIRSGLSDGRALDSVSLNQGATSGTGIPMPATEQALTAMLTRIRGSWTWRDVPPISVRVVGSAAYNATAHPDNVIVVPLGLLMHANSDDEVAWVLAHEFSHVALAHFSRETRQRRLKNSVERITACAAVGLQLADMRFRKTGDQVQAYNAKDKSLIALATQVWAKKNTVKEVLDAYNQGLSREQEDQADALGVDLAINSKYSDGGFGDALTFLQQQEVRDGDAFRKFGNEFGGYMKVTGGQALADMSGGGDRNAVWTKFANGLLDNAKSLALKQVGSLVTASHRPAKKRLVGLGKYMDNAYPRLEPIDGGDTWLKGVRATTEYAEAETTVKAVALSREAIPGAACAPTDQACTQAVIAGIGKALETIRPAQATRYRSTALVVNTVAFLNWQSGNYPAADQMYDLADRVGAPAPPVVTAAKGKGKGKGKLAKAPPPPPAPVPVRAGDSYMQQSLDGFAEHVDLLLRMRNYAKAKGVIVLAKSRYGDDDRFLPAMVTMALQARDVPALTAALARCQQSEDNALVENCELAFINPAEQEKYALLAPADQDKVQMVIARASAEARKGASCGLPSAEEVKKAQAEKDEA